METLRDIMVWVVAAFITAMLLIPWVIGLATILRAW